MQVSSFLLVLAVSAPLGLSLTTVFDRRQVISLIALLSNDPDCDDICRANIIQERRAMMRQSRSSTSRQDVFELSRQRAKLYNTTYQGASCPPGIPCL